MSSQDVAKITEGVKWTYLSIVVSGLLQIGMLAMMARLLVPADFGAIASALLVLRSGQTLVQSGYERAVIWMTDLNTRLLAGLFWVSVATGFILTALFCGVSHPIGFFFGDSQVGDCIKALSPMLLVGSLALVSRGVLRKSYRFAAMGIIDTVSYAIGFVAVGLPIAYWGGGVWSLVAANLSQVGVQTLLCLILQRPVIWRRFSPHEIVAPLKFGYSASGLGLIEFLDTQLPSLFIGRIHGIAALGTYNRAYTLIQLPLEQLGVSMTRVLYSSFSEAKHDAGEVTRVTIPAMKYLCVLIFPLAFGGAAASGTVVTALLGAKWEAAIPVFEILSIGTAAAVVGNLLATLNEALYLFRQKTILQIICTGTQAVGLFWLAPFGLREAAACVCLSRLMFLAGQFVITFRHLKLSAWRIWEVLVPGLVIAVLVVAAVRASEMIGGYMYAETYLKLLLDLWFASMVYGIAIVLVLPELRRRATRIFRVIMLPIK